MRGFAGEGRGNDKWESDVSHCRFSVIRLEKERGIVIANFATMIHSMFVRIFKRNININVKGTLRLILVAGKSRDCVSKI